MHMPPFHPPRLPRSVPRNAPSARNERLPGLFRAHRRPLRPIASSRLARNRFYYVSEPAAIEEVLVTAGRSYIKGRGTQRLERLLGKGLLTSNGAVHLRQGRRQGRRRHDRAGLHAAMESFPISLTPIGELLDHLPWYRSCAFLGARAELDAIVFRLIYARRAQDRREGEARRKTCSGCCWPRATAKAAWTSSRSATR